MINPSTLVERLERSTAWAGTCLRQGNTETAVRHLITAIEAITDDLRSTQGTNLQDTPASHGEPRG